MSSATASAIIVTDPAREKILELRDAESDADRLALRIAVTGVRGVDYTYDLAFELMDEAEATDEPFHVGDGLSVLIPGGDVDKLRGATLDLPSSAGQPGLVLRNPNRPDMDGDNELDLSGDVESQVREVLTKRINPSIAAHGGFAELIRVDGNVAVVQLGGGCQGCGMAQATVAAGIEKTLRDLVPAIDAVRDVTDHESGETPYYAQQ